MNACIVIGNERIIHYPDNITLWEGKFMRTRRFIAAAMAAALTLTAAPAYSLNGIQFSIPASAVGSEEELELWTDGNGLYYDCGSSVATLIKAEGVSGDLVITDANGLDVNTIEEGAFLNCNDVTSITIPDTVVWISPQEFLNCKALKDIWFEGTLYEWNNLIVHPYIPEGVTLHCRSTEDGYVTPNIIDVRFENISGEPVTGIEAAIGFNGSYDSPYAGWRSGEGTASFAVPQDPGEGQYTIRHDAAMYYCVYTDSSTGIGFEDGQTRYSKTIVVDHDNAVTLDELFEDGNYLTEGKSIVVCITGQNIALGGTDNGVMSYQCLRREEDQAFYRLTANKPGNFELIINSDDRDEAESRGFEVTPADEEAMPTRCGGAKLVEAPDTELTPGQSTTMEVWGYSYQPKIYVKEPGSDTWTLDEDGEYIALEEWTVNGEYTTYRLTAIQPCTAKVEFYLPNFGASVKPDLEITVKAQDDLDLENLVCYTGANVVTEPETELVIGQTTTMTIFGGHYKPYVKVYNPETDEWVVDEDGEYVHFEVAGYDGWDTTFKLQALKACRAEVVFYIDMYYHYDSSGVFLDITGEPMEATAPVEEPGQKYEDGEIVKMPQTELAVDQATTMTVYGEAEDLTVKVYGRADDWTADISGDFIKVEKISSEGDLTTYCITPKKACRATLIFGKPDSGNAIDFRIFEGNPIASVQPTEPQAIGQCHGGTKLVKITDTELSVGESTTVITDGVSSLNCDPDGSDNFLYMDICNADGTYTIDKAYEYFDIERISSDNGYTEFRITAKRPCRAKMIVYLSLVGRNEEWDTAINVTGEASAAAAASGVKGDANGDGKVTVADSVTVLQFISNQYKYPMTESAKILADIDGQKGISGGDAIAIQQVDAGVMELD